MIHLALKYLLAKKKQTCFILLGVFLGTCGYIVMSSFLLGLKKYLLEEMVHNEAHVFIKTQEKTTKNHDFDRLFYSANKLINWVNFPSKTIKSNVIKNKEKWLQILKNDPKVKSFSLRYTTNATLFSSNTKIPISLIGCYPEQEKTIKNILPYIIEGKFEDIERGNNKLAIGYNISNLLGLKVNQSILVKTDKNIVIPFKIAAIFKTNNLFIDYQVFGLLPSIQALDRKTNIINEIAVKLHDHTLANNVATQWSLLTEEKIDSWLTLFSSIFKMCSIHDLTRYAITAIIMLIAGFNIYNVLNMSVMQKRKDIAILRSIGYSNKNIMQLFLFQGLIIGILGAFLGIISGYLSSLLLQTTLPSNFYKLSYDFSIYFNAALIGIIFSLISSFFPARCAKKMTPIEIIRSGVE